MNASITRTSRKMKYQPLAAAIAAFCVTLLSLPSHAALFIPPIPLQSGTPVAPNILFILDDSGSMEEDVMRNEEVGEIRTSGDWNERLSLDSDDRNRAYTYNTLYYNPNTTYLPWKDADGNYVAGVTANGTWRDASLASNSGSIQYSDRVFFVPNPDIDDLGDLSQYARYTLERNSSVAAEKCIPAFDSGDDEWKWDCNDVDSFTWQTPDGSITRTVAEEWKNYATWYGYHRTRMKAAKAGASYAFSDLGENYRVGYRSIWQRNGFDIPVGTIGGLFEDNASSTNRTTWFEHLFDAEGSGNTPLQGALQQAGEYFSDSGRSGPWGPGAVDQQLACRQNFAILTTDGYWNNQANFSSVGNIDNTDGPTVTGPKGKSHTYDNVNPYADERSNTLGDIAMEYWKNDLRSDLDNIVPSSLANPAFWQHMVTFGISIGLKGRFSEADIPALTEGSLVWGNPGGTSDKPEKIDDLLHAAVNGHGRFVAATDPDAFTRGLRAALAAIAEATASASNLSFNTASLTAGTQSYVASYVSGQWTGDVEAFSVTEDGVSATPLWSAAAGVPDHASRKVLTHNANGAVPAAFPTLAQSDVLTEAVADYIKGDRAGEGTTYRTRSSVFGDIVNSSPVHVRAGAEETLYVGANDGMLHAIDATNGEELFTYIPGLLDMNELKELSRKTDFVHKYFVDGPLVVSSRTQTPDKNILVGTLGRGGKGVFGLDVSDPDSFSTTGKSWEYAGDDDMGRVLGRPLIVELNDAAGTMAAVVSNGINSTSERAALFVLNLETGALIRKITTNAETNNGLSMPTAVDTDGNGTADVVYAGDLQGNVWRFNLTSSNAGSWSSARLFTATDPVTATKRQPISGGITVAYNPITYEPWVFFGTGRYITDTDPADRSIQSWYGMADNGTAFSGRSQLKARQIKLGGVIDGKDVRAFEESSAGDMLDFDGWVVDLTKPPEGTAQGERMVGDQFVVAGNVLVAASIIPGNTGCGAGGDGFLNLIDAFTGSAVANPFIDANGDGLFNDEDSLPNDTNGDGTGDDMTPVGSIDLGIGMVTDPTALISGGGGAQFCANGTSGVPGCVPFQWGPGFGRVSWREILKD